MQKATDTAAVTTAISSPAWAAWLSQINTALTTVSLVLGLMFLVWRWQRAAAGKGDGE